jgi:hypothetical protein
MSDKHYLDKIGLGYLWQKIKNTIIKSASSREKSYSDGITTTEVTLKNDNGDTVTSFDVYAHGRDGRDGFGIRAKGTLSSPLELYDIKSPEQGDCYLVDGHLWVYNENNEWEDFGLLRGPQGDQGPKGDKGDDGEAGPGSKTYIVATENNYVADKYFDEAMCVNDLVIDNGEIVPERNGNIYRIISIENTEVSTEPIDFQWVETPITNITDSDEVIIVSKTTDDIYYIMFNSKPSGSKGLTAREINLTVKDGVNTIDETTIQEIETLEGITDSTKFNFIFTGNKEFQIKSKIEDKYVYCNTSAPVLINTTTYAKSNLFTIDDTLNLLKNISLDPNKYVGVYKTNSDWRSYALNSNGKLSNINGQQTMLFVKRVKSTASTNLKRAYIDTDRYINITNNINNTFGYVYNSTYNSFATGANNTFTSNISVKKLTEARRNKIYEITGIYFDYYCDSTSSTDDFVFNFVGDLYRDNHYKGTIDISRFVDISSGTNDTTDVFAALVFNMKDNAVLEDVTTSTAVKFSWKHTTGAKGLNAFSCGENTTSNALSTHTEGEWTTASGDYSHAEGEYSVAYGEMSHAEGEYTTAYGFASHAEGVGTAAAGFASHAEGEHTVTKNNNEHAEGAYNVSHTNQSNTKSGMTLHSIGIGESEENRRNAVEVMQNGDVYIKGVGDYDGKTLSNAKSLQKILGSGEIGDSIKRIEVSDISKFYYGFEDLSFYGLKPEDIDKLLDNKGEIEITVNLLPMFLNIMAGQDILKDVSSTFPYNLLFKNSNKTKFSTSNSEIQMLPQNAEELRNLGEISMLCYDNLEYLCSENPFISDTSGLGSYHLMGAGLGTYANAHIVFMNWVLAQLYLPFCNFEIPKCFIKSKITANNVFDLKLNTAYLISENKLGLVTLYDDVETLDSAILKLFIMEGLSNSDSSSSAPVTTSTFVNKFIDAFKSLALIGMRSCMIDNLLKDIPQNNTITDMYDAIYYVINQYTILYKDEIEAYISKFGFSDLDEYLNAVYSCLYLAKFTLTLPSFEGFGGSGDSGSSGVDFGELQEAISYMSTEIDPNNFETLRKSSFSVAGINSGSDNIPIHVFFPEAGLSWIEPQILFHVCNNIVYGNKAIVQDVEE